MNRRHIGILLSLVVLCLWPTASEAASFGRVSITVKGPDGEVIPGVRVSVTCPEIAYSKEIETDKKGRATLSVVDSSKEYRLVFEREGFQPQEVMVKPQLGGTVKRELVMTPVPKAREQPKAAGLTPAQEVFNQGVEDSKEGDRATARAKFLEALELDPDLAVAHLALAGLYLEAGEHQAGLSAAKRAVELDPNNVLARRLLYELHTRLGNTEEAAEVLDLLSQIDEGGEAAAMIFNEGTAAYRVGDGRTAKERFRRALEIDPGLKAAMQALAIVYLREGSYADAGEMVERFLALEPGNATMLRLRWDIARAAGDPEEEREAFRALAAVDTEVLVADFLDRGVKAFEQGEVAAARSSFERILELEPDHPRAHYRLGLCLISGGENKEAREHLERFIALAPGDPEAQSAKEMLSFLQ